MNAPLTRRSLLGATAALGAVALPAAASALAVSTDAMSPEAAALLREFHDVAGRFNAAGVRLDSTMEATVRVPEPEARRMVPGAVDVAGLMGGAGLPMAERGAAGIFGGRLAATADHAAADRAEARNVEARADMGAGQRTATAPWSTQDVSDARQLRGTGGIDARYDGPGGGPRRADNLARGRNAAAGAVPPGSLLDGLLMRERRA